ncbi:2-polyprenyl-6-methoxyphenol hydroxylase-like oxidoreductase [Cylindrospermum stagnale PCC 7417]|uniref:2-polyprenyl-6-methoxyphenol hydroxylase-like oxidoreductase n=1 Tax=Cylindrospermum stagnale PCC 7417 TaxID=56107 RepID=K9WRJ3_9NOST|nr:FAD-dependent oxidoreductase [Cylindrospermum stagnale]AFZ22406.1 2-polyprenyl-6-methoxyphenol hydroxylase-like oxidoreductase [Cylindrospermum stagnale PCC 7417]
MSQSVEQTPITNKESSTPDVILDVQQTSCCIVGGGPTGAVLALLLARQGIPVTLIEAQKNFNRDFRGDVLHAGAMGLLDEMGLSDRLLAELPYSTTETIKFLVGGKNITFADVSGLMQTRYPYMTIIPQGKLLDFLTIEAKRYPNFQLLMGANVQQLIEEDGMIRGVRYRGQGGWHEVRSHLTVAADGRFSNIRKLAGMEFNKMAMPLELFWFRLPRYSHEAEGVISHFGKKRILVKFNTYDGNWQIAYYIPKADFRQIQAAGIEAMQQSIVGVVPEFSDRVHHLQDWKQTARISLELGRLSRWYRPGLLVIGDAAHVMLPLGGVGINYAIQDAVTAANILIEPLKRGKLQLHHLAKVQRQRELPIKVIQSFQAFLQKNVTAKAIRAENTYHLPPYWGLPFLRNIVAEILAFGVFPPHLKTEYALPDAEYETGDKSSQKASTIAENLSAK